jgi:diketogulonate reductase-like aldo/keto reductase
VDADREQSQPHFRQAVELGITFWDTANVYSYGGSEEIVDGRPSGSYAPSARQGGEVGRWLS